MEKFSFSLPEYQVLKKHRVELEKCFDVQICLPNFCGQKQSAPVSVNINIGGEPRNVDYVKKFLKREMGKKAQKANRQKNKEPCKQPESTVPLITIDDDDEDSIVCSQTTNPASSSSCSSISEESQSPKSSGNNQNADDSIVIESPKSSGNDQNADDSIVILSEVIVSPTKQAWCQSKPSSSKDSNKVAGPLPEFLPLRVRNYRPPGEKGRQTAQVGKREKRTLDVNDCVEVLSVSKAKRVLRPIVIDGSNVARYHGRPTNTFSCKGIKICVDYFLKRGHTDIKVLLPHFKKYMSSGSVVTTDPEILDELEKSNMVVYTPSRRVNERRITPYDDRFIVSLASQNNGVIVSNDNYRDIMMESPEFKKTIDERLLMFCFAGDIIMIPEDPLGVFGPKLNDFLSMKV